jgi:hypothetical protein
MLPFTLSREQQNCSLDRMNDSMIMDVIKANSSSSSSSLAVVSAPGRLLKTPPPFDEGSPSSAPFARHVNDVG